MFILVPFTWFTTPSALRTPESVFSFPKRDQCFFPVRESPFCAECFFSLHPSAKHHPIRAIEDFREDCFFLLGTPGLPGNRCERSKFESRQNLDAGCFALRARTYPYDRVKRPADAMLGGALMGFLRRLGHQEERRRA